MPVVQINSYVKGNRVIVTATCVVTATDALTTPSTWTLLVRNLKDPDATTNLLTFTSVGPAVPSGVNATMDNPSAGVIKFGFDVDEPGERRLYFAGTGACKCAAKSRFVVEEGDV